jgi:hypothetical protein
MPDRRTFLGFAAALLPFAVEAQTPPAQTSAAQTGTGTPRVDRTV